MKLKRIMIAAPKSGSGKTTITCALLQALKSEGQQVASYKCGPDYIDPMFHEKAIGIPSKNLDTFFAGETEIKELLLKNRKKEDFAVIEGVMGLFDGLGGIREEGSSYHLAELTETPIVLVIDAKGMGRSLIPFIAGFLAYDKKYLIQGIILNRMSKTYYEIIKPLIEEELQINVLGYFPDCKELTIESRHLGLVMPNELNEIKSQLKAISVEFTKTVSLEDVVKIAETASELGHSNKVEKCRSVEDKREIEWLEIEWLEKDRPIIAVARDEAFCFYYEENLLMLQKYGAEIKYFSLLHDSKLPDKCNALLIGGGYPELYVKKLCDNNRMRMAIKKVFDDGMPIVAECGGFMYLHTAIVGRDGVSYDMAQVIPAICSNSGKLIRFGYVEIEEKESRFLPEGERIKGHEFHYYDSTDNGDSCFAIKPLTDKRYSCVIEGANYWMGFPHLYYPSNPVFAKTFVKKAEEYKKRLETSYMENSHRFFENKNCNYFPCHKGSENFNCLFCYCPLYNKNCLGNPQFMDIKGKRVKVCTNCIFPHRPENYDEIIRMLKKEL